MSELLTSPVQIAGASFGEFTDGRTLNDLRPFIGRDGRAYVSEPHVGRDGKIEMKAVPITAPGMQARNAASLRRDEWKEFDDVLQNIFQRPMTGVQDLINAGLTKDFDGYASTVMQYENISDINGASMDMDPDTQGKNDGVQYDTGYLPLPIIHKEFSIGDRQLAMSRKLGQPLDTTNLEAIGRKINEYREEMLFNGVSSFTYGGGIIYGYLDFPDAATASFSTTSTSGGWSNSTGAQIVVDVQAMIASMLSNRAYGPWMIYCPETYESALSSDFKAASDKTVRQRLLELNPGIMGIKTSPFITTDEVVMVEMNTRTVRLVRGMPATTVQWQVRPLGRHNYKVLMIEVPQLRTDQEDRAGITILS